MVRLFFGSGLTHHSGYGGMMTTWMEVNVHNAG